MFYFTKYNSVDIFASLKPQSGIEGFNDSAIEGMDCNCLPSCSEQVIYVYNIWLDLSLIGYIVIRELVIIAGLSLISRNIFNASSKQNSYEIIHQTR